MKITEIPIKETKITETKITETKITEIPIKETKYLTKEDKENAEKKERKNRIRMMYEKDRKRAKAEAKMQSMIYKSITGNTNKKKKTKIIYGKYYKPQKNSEVSGCIIRDLEHIHKKNKGKSTKLNSNLINQCVLDFMNIDLSNAVERYSYDESLKIYNNYILKENRNSICNLSKEPNKSLLKSNDKSINDPKKSTKSGIKKQRKNAFNIVVLDDNSSDSEKSDFDEDFNVFF